MKARKNKSLIILIGLLVAACTVLSYGQDLKIVVKNVKGDDGKVLLALYNSENEFLKKEFKLMEVKSINGEAVATFSDVAPGTYAISVIHDANNNKELDSNLFGMPKEGFGFSNDAMGSFGPPDFKMASFEIAKPIEINIKMRYL